MADKVEVWFKENDSAKWAHGFHVPSTATNAEIQEYVATLPAHTLGIIQEIRRHVEIELPKFTPAQSPSDSAPTNAQGGQRWVLVGQNANGNRRTSTIPTADSTQLTAGSDQMPLSDTEIAATLAKLNAMKWVDKDDSEITIQSWFYKNTNSN